MRTRYILSMGVIGLVMFVACQSTLGSDRPAQELLLPVEYLPSGWLTYGSPRSMGPQIGFGDEDDSYITFSLEDDEYTTARHFVLHYPSASAATDSYLKLFSSEFNDNSIAIEAPWETLPELSYTNPKAEQFHMACVTNLVTGPKQICKMMAQYENYIVIFSSHTGPNTMSLSEFNSVIRSIDEIMVKELQLD